MSVTVGPKKTYIKENELEVDPSPSSPENGDFNSGERDLMKKAVAQIVHDDWSAMDTTVRKEGYVVRITRQTKVRC